MPTLRLRTGCEASDRRGHNLSTRQSESEGSPDPVWLARSEPCPPEDEGVPSNHAAIPSPASNRSGATNAADGELVPQPRSVPNPAPAWGAPPRSRMSGALPSSLTSPDRTPAACPPNEPGAQIRLESQLRRRPASRPRPSSDALACWHENHLALAVQVCSASQSQLTDPSDPDARPNLATRRPQCPSW
jgi:hypothetical protein